MHPQPSQADALAHAILGLLIDDHPALWSVTELERTLAPSTPHDTAEALTALYGAGLVHRVGDFVFASRAAHEAQRLAG